MILSGNEIREQLGRNIAIDPFDERYLNPNSYNLTLHHELMTYEEVVLDMKKANRVRRIEIPGRWFDSQSESIVFRSYCRAHRNA